MSLVTITGLTKKFNTNIAVHNLNLELNKGVCTALLGPNGAGKTTTLSMLAGIMKPTSGSIAFSGVAERDFRKYIGYLPQYPVFYGWMSGKEYLQYVGQLASLSKNEAATKAGELLELVGIADAKKRKISGYSGGMKQRLGIAQALINDPLLLILDEPVSALDPIGRREVLTLMRELKEKTTILFSTHVLHDAEEICDYIYIVKNGEMAINGTLDELQNTHQQPTIYIEGEKELDEWLPKLKQYSFVSELVSNTPKTVTVTVTNVETARRELLNYFGSLNVPIRKFELVRTSLEDLFLKVAKK
ncbi:ATP-binding cassette domain-containing protein [Anaerobacillus isosaccharinicus]|uniref:ABC transporter ATP-binding protein n=1 Tax=Anaerobacillus isosaccharinicus TaxID=1532552 RepID=A0A1S2M8L1_9BACI|nr:ABC transporter ATP-binding protein [Anaerobacillus isosaccharinicus]MBA5588391.1 ABC transporter ATP-binding protein [Anaerobacillus isosaccharinicus]QOY38177.1 ABC transporter ATP-binding protein [Anaerobacillus isosaccharinicus]